MKKFLTGLLLFVFMGTLAGCGRKPTAGLFLSQKETVAAVKLRDGVEAALTQAGCLVEAYDAGNDQSRQNRQIRGLLWEGCDLLIVEPVMTAAAEEILRQAREENVPVLFLNCFPEALPSEDCCCIGSDMSSPGLAQNQLVMTLPDGGDVNGDGIVTYTVIGGLPNHIDALRWTEDNGQGLTAQRLAADYGAWSVDSGHKLCRQQLRRFDRRIEVIFCNSDRLALGALKALQEAEIPPGQIRVVGIGGDAEALERIAEGTIAGTVCPNVPELIRRITETAEKLLQGIPAEGKQPVGFTVITKDNVRSYM